MEHSERLKSSTVDDVEGTLYKFIPPGMLRSSLSHPFLTHNLDYYKNEEDFNARVEKDALSFKPYGEKIYSYKRNVGGKGKSKTNLSVSGTELDVESPGVVEFEVYHASTSPVYISRAMTN